MYLLNIVLKAMVWAKLADLLYEFQAKSCAPSLDLPIFTTQVVQMTVIVYQAQVSTLPHCPGNQNRFLLQRAYTTRPTCETQHKDTMCAKPCKTQYQYHLSTTMSLTRKNRGIQCALVDSFQ